MISFELLLPAGEAIRLVPSAKAAYPMARISRKSVRKINIVIRICFYLDSLSITTFLVAW